MSQRTEFIAEALYNSFRTNLRWDHWNDQTEQAKDGWRAHARAAELAGYQFDAAPAPPAPAIDDGTSGGKDE